MPSTLPGRYNNVSNSNIDLGAVNTATTGGTDMNSYRGRSGIPASGQVSFSDLRGVFKTTTNTNLYIVPTQSNGDNTFEQYWVYTQYRNGSYGSGYYSNYYPTGATQFAYVQYTALTFQYNLDTGGYNWGYYFTDRSQNDGGNYILAALMNKKTLMFTGNLNDTTREFAIASGFIGNKYRTSGFSVAPVATYGIDYLLNGNVSIGSIEPDNQNGIFRTNTRDYLKAIWITGGNLYFGTLYTSPFNSGGALSGYTSSLILSSGNSYQMNNSLGFIWGQHYGSDQPSGYYPLLQWYDVGLRNATVLDSPLATYLTNDTAVDNTTAVLPFNT